MDYELTKKLKTPKEKLDKIKKWKQENSEKVKEYRKKYRKDNPAKIKFLSLKWRKENPGYWRKDYWENREKRLEQRRQYRIRHREAIKITRREYWENNRHKEDAYSKIFIAVRSGRIKRLPCEVCGEPKTHGHHKDYSKPLEVNWLCSTHHGELHRKPLSQI